MLSNLPKKVNDINLKGSQIEKFNECNELEKKIIQYIDFFCSKLYQFKKPTYVNKINFAYKINDFIELTQKSLEL